MAGIDPVSSWQPQAYAQPKVGQEVSIIVLLIVGGTKHRSQNCVVVSQIRDTGRISDYSPPSLAQVPVTGNPAYLSAPAVASAGARSVSGHRPQGTARSPRSR